MKILFLYTPNQSLLSRFYRELLEALCSKGHEVRVYYEKRQPKSFEKEGVYYHGERKGALWRRYLNIGRVIYHYKPDVVVSNFSYINPALVMGKLLGIKKNMAWFHTAYSHSKRLKFHVWFKTQCFKWAHQVITNSHKLAEDIQFNYGVQPNQVQVIPFWTEIDQVQATTIEGLTHDQTSIYLGIPARLVQDKNHEVVFKALSQLKEKRRWHLFLAGSGAYEMALKKLIVTYGLEQQVTFLGSLDSGQMKYFYQTMDLLILPSLHESFGLVYLEAIALGRPVLVSQAFGALDFLTDVDYDLKEWTFPPNSETQLLTLLNHFFNGDAPSGSRFKACHTLNFDKEHLINQYEQLITTIKK